MEPLKNKKPFKVPDAYFEGFTVKMIDKLSKNAAFDPETTPVRDGFKVPGGYFESFTDRLIASELLRDSKVVRLNFRKAILVGLSAAASVAVLIAGFLYLKASQEITFDNIASSEIERYLELNQDDLSSYELAEQIPVDNLETYELLGEPLDENNVLDYLSNNIDDIHELNLEDNGE